MDLDVPATNTQSRFKSYILCEAQGGHGRLSPCRSSAVSTADKPERERTTWACAIWDVRGIAE